MSNDNIETVPIYKYKSDKPMRIVAFVSGGGGNLNAEIEVQKKYPDLVSVELVIADRLGTRAIEIAKENKITYIEKNFESICGIWDEVKNSKIKSNRYKEKAIQFHNEILKDIQKFELLHNQIDLAVLSYRRWIHGDLLNYFENRMINQHAGDLTIFNEDGSRKYIGVNPVYDALLKGEKKTRTSTFLVNNGHDMGEILSQGPIVYFDGTEVTKEIAYEHELKQKEDSDWPSLQFAIKEIALGNYSVINNKFHNDGCRVLMYKNRELPYGGIDLEEINGSI